MVRKRYRVAGGILGLFALIAVGVVALSMGSSHAACAGGAVATASTDTEPPLNQQFGAFEDLEYLSGSALQTRLDEFADLGLRWARLQMIWGTVQQGGPTSYQWSNYDAVISGLLAKGIQPLIVIDTSPTWDRVSGCTAGLTCAPADPAAYASFAAAAVARYAPMGVHDWEIWNEPNNDDFWAPTPDASAYTTLLRDAYQAIKRVDPSSTVISGGLAPEATGSGPSPATIAPLTFLASIYADGGQGSFDAVGWHPYTYPETPTSTDPDNAWYEMSGTPTSVRSLMVTNGDGDKRIWATEFGAPTDPDDPQGVTPAEQATIYAEALHLWSTYPWAGPLFAFQYQDAGTDESTLSDFFGLVNADGTPKPAYAVVASTIQADDAAAASGFHLPTRLPRPRHGCGGTGRAPGALRQG